ncbi:MAG: fucose isomerase [Phycisphaeraceae bacterium]|nr:fucose isomerase [Phycisphaeraceae bacterium]
MATNQTIQLLVNGDLRITANQNCWEAQKEMELTLTQAVKKAGYSIKRAHPYKADQKHGFIQSQKEGMAVFSKIDPTAPLIIAEAVWQYSHHLLPGLLTHKGPILTVANWSGTWPGLVGMLNLNGSMTKAGIKYSTLWSDDFTDKYFLTRLEKWLKTGKCSHATKHVSKFKDVKVPGICQKIGEKLAADMSKNKAILGVFDEGCMGMFNGIIPDHLMNPTGVFKERLSQSALYYETTQVTNKQAKEVYDWYIKKGMTFHLGKNEKTELTKNQILLQCKMYIAAVRIADDFGCHTIGIQYQQGLKDLLPASDLVEGTLNNTDRPPVLSRDGKRVLYKGQPIPHFNEVDECAGIDGLMTYRVHKELKQPVENTLHDLRWGDWDQSGTTDDYVWVFLISGSAPPAHHIGGWKGSEGLRQPGMYFRLGGSTLRGIAKVGEMIWSRVWVDGSVPGGKLCMDLGRAQVIKLPQAETQRRWDETTVQWPIMHAVTYGVTREQMMARHKSNHIQCVYAKDNKAADQAMLTKAAMARAMGMEVAICGTQKDGKAW